MTKYCYEYSCRLGIMLSLISDEYKNFTFQVTQNKHSNELLITVANNNKEQKHFYLINDQRYEPFNIGVLTNIRNYCKQL